MAKSISPDIKAAALADLASGEQPAVVAERYGLGRPTVKSWARRLKDQIVPPDAEPDAPPAASSDASIASRASTPLRRPTLEQHQRDLGVAILDLLQAKLRASQAIAEVALDPQWRARQPADQLATFGAWLDSTAFAIGDRLAQSATRHESAADDSGLPD